MTTEKYTLNPNLSEAERYKGFCALLLAHMFAEKEPTIVAAGVIAGHDLGFDVSETLAGVVDNFKPSMALLDSQESERHVGITLGGVVYEICSNFTADGSQYKSSDAARDAGFKAWKAVSVGDNLLERIANMAREK